MKTQELSLELQDFTLFIYNYLLVISTPFGRGPLPFKQCGFFLLVEKDKNKTINNNNNNTKSS